MTTPKALLDTALDTDVTLAADSDTKIATQKAVKAYVAAAVTSLFEIKGSTNCSANPNYPAASAGDVYVVSVAGKIGGASGTVVEVNDTFTAIADNAGGTQAGVGASWVVGQGNVVAASEGTAGILELATQAEVDAADATRAVVGATLAAALDALQFGWVPVLTAGCSEVDRVFTTTAGDSWAKGARSARAYGGDVDFRFTYPSVADVFVGFDVAAITSNYYNAGTGWYVGGGATARPRNAGTPVSSDVTGLTAGVSYLGCRRVGSNVEYYHSKLGDGSDLTVHFTQADPLSGAAVYLVCGAYPSATTFGPVVRIAGVPGKSAFGASLIGATKLHPTTPTGALQANSLFFVVGVPNNADGANGDYAFRTTDGGAATHIYHKLAGVWGAVI